MGMSSYILDNEEKFWDKVYDKITESEHISEAMSFAVELGNYSNFPKVFSGNNSVGVTPDPIPNSEVKAHCADGTARETSVGE